MRPMLIIFCRLVGPGKTSQIFFSSRRRHTMSKRDWSSDVCSSDLPTAQRGAAGRGRLAIVVRAAPPEARKIAAALNAEGRAGITVTFALTALDVLADRELPLFIAGRGHDLAFAGYTDLDTTRLPEPIWTAETALGRRFVESAAGREIRVYIPTAGGDMNASALETARRAERSGLVPLLPAPAPATRGDLDGLVLV